METTEILKYEQVVSHPAAGRRSSVTAFTCLLLFGVKPMRRLHFLWLPVCPAAGWVISEVLRVKIAGSRQFLYHMYCYLRILTCRLLESRVVDKKLESPGTHL